MLKDQKELLERFNAHGVKYLVVGGHAVGIHAEPRGTKDLDIFIKSDPCSPSTEERCVAAASSCSTHNSNCSISLSRFSLRFPNCIWVSSPRESHPRALAEPDVNLSVHPAPITEPPPRSRCSSARKGGPLARVALDPLDGANFVTSEVLELPHRPVDEGAIDMASYSVKRRAAESTVVVYPSSDFRVELLREIVQGLVAFQL